MTYSSALYRDASQSLEHAQREKYARVLAALDLRPGMRVLEIGCGWGAMAEAIARAGAHVTAITARPSSLPTRNAALPPPASTPYATPASATTVT